MVSRHSHNTGDSFNNGNVKFNGINWKQQPYKAAYRITGSKELAMEILVLAEWVKEIGLTEYPEIEVIETEYR